MDPRLETLLNNMFRRCIEDQQYRHAIGIALETHRMDWFREAIMTSVGVEVLKVASVIGCGKFLGVIKVSVGSKV